MVRVAYGLTMGEPVGVLGLYPACFGGGIGGVLGRHCELATLLPSRNSVDEKSRLGGRDRPGGGGGGGIFERTAPGAPGGGGGGRFVRGGGGIILCSPGNVGGGLGATSASAIAAAAGSISGPVPAPENIPGP